jgi:hypothetical protein
MAMQCTHPPNQQFVVETNQVRKTAGLVPRYQAGEWDGTPNDSAFTGERVTCVYGCASGWRKKEFGGCGFGGVCEGNIRMSIAWKGIGEMDAAQ